VGILATAFTLIFGSAVGIIAGYRGGWLDSVIGRIAEIFLAIPISSVDSCSSSRSPMTSTPPFAIAVGKVAFVIAILAWPTDHEADALQRATGQTE
jgi:oligopeptide transport system permease protein